MPPRTIKHNYNTNEIVVLDVEASSLDLQKSYPIEVAWISLSKEQDNFLINPNSAKNWVDWSEESQAIHNIPRETCVKDGISVLEACARLNDQLLGCLIITDAVDFDFYWIKRLFDESGEVMKFDFIGLYEFAIRTGNPESIEAYQEIKSRKIITHRALDDCQTILSCGIKAGIFPK